MLRIIRNDSIENSAVFQENYHHELLLTQIVKMHVSANSDGFKDTIVILKFYRVRKKFKMTTLSLT